MNNEELIISCILNDTSIHDVAIPYLKRPYFDRHRDIADAIITLYEQTKPVDTYTLAALLPNQLDNLLRINTLVASAANVMQYVAALKDEYVRKYLQRLIGREIELTIDPHDVLSDLIAELSGLQEGVTPHEMPSLVDICDDAVRRIDERTKNPSAITGIPTPICELNSLTKGWQPGHLIVLAGRPGMGKTAFGLANVRTACENGKSVAYCSLEMTNLDLAERLIIGFGGDPFEAAGSISRWKLQPLDKGGIDLFFIRSQARMLKRMQGLDLIVIDYLGLMKMPEKELRAYQIGEVTHQLKALAKELNIPIILLCQLNRDIENRSDGQHKLSDLRESGDIEQDADLVIFISRPAKFGFAEDKDELSTENMVVLQVEKNRHGPAPRVIKCMHNETFTWFYDYYKK